MLTFSKCWNSVLELKGLQSSGNPLHSQGLPATRVEPLGGAGIVAAPGVSRGVSRRGVNATEPTRASQRDSASVHSGPTAPINTDAPTRPPSPGPSSALGGGEGTRRARLGALAMRLPPQRPGAPARSHPQREPAGASSAVAEERSKAAGGGGGGGEARDGGGSRPHPPEAIPTRRFREHRRWGPQRR